MLLFFKHHTKVIAIYTMNSF